MCNEFYIGESGKSARIRITQHIRAIINFKPYVKYTNEVGYHFNLKNHNYKRDFQFFIFKCNVYTKIDRLSIETDLIHLVNMFMWYIFLCLDTFMYPSSIYFNTSKKMFKNSNLLKIYQYLVIEINISIEMYLQYISKLF